MVKDKYLKESLNTQRLNELASKYGLANYVPGQSFDTVKDKMSAEDYETSQKLMNYYTNQKSLTDAYNYNKDLVEQNQKKVLQENAISKELAMKYMPEHMKLQGMGGLGVSESSVIEANNNFRNARNTINADAELRKNELLKNYQDDMRNLDNSATTETQSIRDKYQAIFEENSATKLANLETLLIDKLSAMSQDSQGRISKEDKQMLKDMIDNSRSEMTESDQQIADSYIDNIQERPEDEVKAEKSYNEIKTSDVSFNNNGGWWIFGATDYRDGDNFSVKDKSGFKYRIQSGGKVEDADVIEASQKLGNGSVFGYRNKLYYKKDGTIYLIEKRDNSYGDHYSKLYNKFYG